MSYHHILARCIGVPLNIEQSKLDLLASEVFLKLMLDASTLDRSASTPITESNFAISAPDNVCVIPVHGSLVNKNGAGSSGVTSYAGITRQIQYAVQAKMNGEELDTLFFDLSSGGGESQGNFPLSDLIYSLPSKFGLKTIAFTDSTAASACYAIMAACQKTYCVDTSMIGSIGTLMTLMDATKADDKAGLKYTILRSKADKAAYNPHESISEKVLAESEALLKVWDDKFNNIIMKYRPQITMEILTELNGKCVTGTEALKLGLVDAIVSSADEIFTELKSDSTEVEPDEDDAPIYMQFPSTNSKIGNSMNLEQALAQLVEVQSQLDMLKASNNLNVQKAVQDERTRTLNILEARTTFGVSEKTALNAVKQGFTLDQTTSMFTEIKAALDDQTAVITGNINANAQQGQGPQGVGAGSVTAQTLQELANKQQPQGQTVAGGTLSLDAVFKAMSDIGAERLGVA